MNDPGHHTYNEIVSQPEAWAQALEVTVNLRDEISSVWNDMPRGQILFTGCGSTYYLSLAAASLFTEIAGYRARAFPAGEVILHPNAVYEVGPPVMLVAFSRSGRTTETLTAAKRHQELNLGPIVFVTNNGNSELAELADLVIAISAGQERSVAQTRSFASMYVAVSALALIISGREDVLESIANLPAMGRDMIDKYEDLARTIGEDLHFDRYYFLGSGTRYGLACELNLKMKEMTLTHSEPFHFLEFRHGPMSMVGDSAVIVGLVSPGPSSQERSVLREMKALGAKTVSFGSNKSDVCLDASIPGEVRNVLYLPVNHLMTYYRSLAKGLNPDQPRNLSAVVYLDLSDLSHSSRDFRRSMDAA